MSTARARPRRRAVLLAATVLAVGLISAGCDDDDPAGPLRWEGEPALLEAEAGLPDDRIISGEVRNSSLEPIAIEADELVVIADGEEFETDTTFLAGYGRGFVETARGYADPDDVPDFERVRTGRLLQLEPGGTTPVVVAWRDAEAGAIDGVRYPRGFLPVDVEP